MHISVTGVGNAMSTHKLEQINKHIKPYYISIPHQYLSILFALKLLISWLFLYDTTNNIVY